MSAVKNHRPRIVVLDGFTLNPGDLSWRKLECLGKVSIYDRTSPAEIVPRSKNARILVVNKVVIDESTLADLPGLEYIVVTATGYNNIELEACRKQGIRVSNAVGYSAPSVAQHVFALLLELTNRVDWHDRSVKGGDWSHQPDFSYWKAPIVELAGKTMGVYGLGSIGRRVAGIAMGFGMEVLATHRHPERDAMDGVRFVELTELFAQSDVVSLNVPLSTENKEIVDADLLARMKPSAFLINTARGGLINEADLEAALRQKTIAGAALDVLANEPPPADHPLFELDNCLITPHQAWASLESRQRLMEITIDNVCGFLHGEVRNDV